MKLKHARSHEDELRESLKDPVQAAGYLEAAYADSDRRVFLLALYVRQSRARILCATTPTLLEHIPGAQTNFLDRVRYGGEWRRRSVPFSFKRGSNKNAERHRSADEEDGGEFFDRVVKIHTRI